MKPAFEHSTPDCHCDDCLYANPVRMPEVEHDAPMVAGFIDYLREVAQADHTLQIPIGKLWMLYHDSVRRGMMPIEVIEDLQLPIID